ncbi:MAG TPA: Uma2 family endonuclease [Longimicrobiales bacterium]
MTRQHGDIEERTPSADDERPVSIEEYQRLPKDDLYHVELVRGRLVREPRPAPPHSRAQMRVAATLDAYARATGLGDVLPEVGFILSDDPPTVRGPDVAFVSRARIPEGGYAVPGFWRIAPDLAVEVVSPSNSAGGIREKVRAYLDAGTRIVWVVDPRTRTVTVHRPQADAVAVCADAVLTAPDLLPGLEIPLSELFPDP